MFDSLSQRTQRARRPTVIMLLAARPDAEHGDAPFSTRERRKYRLLKTNETRPRFRATTLVTQNVPTRAQFFNF
jgi:hypothetical protein